MSKRLRQRWRQNWLLGVLQRRRDRCEPRRWAGHRGALLRGQLARREMCQRWGLAGTVVTLTMRRRAAARPLQMQVRLHQARLGCGLWEHSARWGRLRRGQLVRPLQMQVRLTVVTLTMRRRAAARPLQMQVRLHQARVGCGLWEHSA